MVLLDVLGAIFGGGLTGLIGNISTAIINYKMQKIKNEHEVNLERIKIDAFKAKAEVVKNTIKDTANEISDMAQETVEAQDAISFTKSIQYGNEKLFGSNWIERLLQVKGWTSWISFPIAYVLIVLFGIVDFFKGLMRPAITIYMILAATWVTWLSYGILDKAGIEKMDINEATSIFRSVIMIIVYLAVSCVTWWFGDRRTAKFLMRLTDGNFKPKDDKKEDEESSPLAPT